MSAPSFVPVAKGKFVGRSVTRLEDLPLVTGRGRYAASISFPHQLHMRVVRSSSIAAHISTIGLHLKRWVERSDTHHCPFPLNGVDSIAAQNFCPFGADPAIELRC